MLRKSFMILAVSALPGALSAQGTDEQAYAAAVRAGACVPEGIASATYLPDGRVSVRCNGTGVNGGAAAGVGALVILAALAGGGGSGTTTTTTTASD
jgi:hypothetical protein